MSNQLNVQPLSEIFGPSDQIPLLGDLIGPKLLELVVRGMESNLGSNLGIVQNDGVFFPKEYRKTFKHYCQEIRSTEEGEKLCLACNWQGLNLVGHHEPVIPGDIKELIKKYPIDKIREYPEYGVYSYRCAAGLVELIGAISLDFNEGNRAPIAGFWAGQNKVDTYLYSTEEVGNIGLKIKHAHPEDLTKLYDEIEHKSEGLIGERVKELADTMRPIEDAASASFHNKKRMQYDQIILSLLNNMSSFMSKKRAISSRSIQKEIYQSMAIMLSELTNKIGRCYSALCTAQPKENDAMVTRIDVIAHAGVCSRKLKKTYHINVNRKDFDRIICNLYGSNQTKTYKLSDVNSEFLSKLKRSINIDNISHATLGCIAAGENRILWVTLLCDNCGVLTPMGHILPSYIKTIDIILQNTSQFMEIGHLMDQQRDQVRVLKERTIQIADKDKQRRTLISNIAHQVSRPIMELKNSAYTLSHYGFSEENYRDFRACLMELERGCRNFNIYEQLSTDLKKDEDIYQASASFSIKEIIDKAHDRLRPFLKSKNIEISVKVCTEKGQEIPKVIGNPEGTLECVVNVLHNSIKYSIGSRPIEVNISHTSKLWVYVRVTNYGIYLLDSDRERIFDETIRGETAKTVSIEGSGIGLYISRKLINLHNGHISVESSEPSEPRKDGVPRWKTTFLISLKC